MKFYIAPVAVLVLSVVMTMTSAAAIPIAENALGDAEVNEVPRCCIHNGVWSCGPFSCLKQ